MHRLVPHNGFFPPTIMFVHSLLSFGLLTRLLPGGGPPPPLRLTPTSSSSSHALTVVIFADLHFGEEEHGWGVAQDANSTRVMDAVLDAEAAAGLVVLNGDLVTGENTLRANASGYVRRVVAPMRRRNIPWASTYGNHDSQFNLSREALLRAEKAFPRLSYTQRMDARLPGVTNYYLLVRGSHGRDRPVAVLWFFDSRGGAPYQREGDAIPDWVAGATARWFAATSRRLRARYGPLPSIAFVHIPPRPYLAAQQDGLDPARFPGLNEDVPVSVQGGQGGHQDDDAFVEALRHDPSLHSVYVGHDHGASWCATWPSSATKKSRPIKQGPFLCFARHTGYGGYGEWDRGARVVQLSFDQGGEMTVKTWVRMESGDVITAVTLNETYGVDVYPVTNT